MLIWKLIGVLLLLQVALAGKGRRPAKCGKGSLKLKFGQAKSLRSPPNDAPITCTYKIRAPPGFHIQVRFNQLNVGFHPPGFTIYDAAKRPFRWKATSELSLPSEAAGSTVTYPTGTLAVKYRSSPGVSVFAITAKAVLPEDGNCGYVVKATGRRRSLRSPGWPKVKSPSGMRCKWTIRAASEGYQAVFRIDGLKTDDGQDYVEVFDGNRSLDFVTGKVKRPREYTSTNGELQVYYHTESGTSKGFKAKYEQRYVNFTTPIDGSDGYGGDYEEGEGTRCHSRTRARVAATGATIRDSEFPTTCPPETTCAQLSLEGTANSYGGMKITYDAGTCIPVNMCAGNPCEFAAKVPPEVNITMTSCRAICCFEELCNTAGLVDTREVMPSVSVPPITPGGGSKKCYRRTSITTVPDGTKLMNDQSETECGPSERCALFTTEGVSRTFGDISVRLEAGMCVPSVVCLGDPCRTMPRNPDITVTSCHASCCDSDFCNAAPQAEAVSPSQGPLAIECYDILSSKGSGIVFLDNKSVKTCAPGHKCSRISTVATSTETNIEVTTVYGSCLPSLACNYLTCDSLPNSMPNLEVQSCQATCCDGSLCNGDGEDGTPPVSPELPPGDGHLRPVVEPKNPYPEVTEDKVSPPASPIHCYGVMVIEVSGRKPVNQQTAMQCTAGQVCMLINANAHMAMGGSNTEAKMTYGACMNAEICDPNFCSQLSSVPGIPSGATFDGCKISCCNGPLCNAP